MDKLGFVSKHKKGTESREEEEEKEKENKYAKLGSVALSLSWNKSCGDWEKEIKNGQRGKRINCKNTVY